jgi:hypothetical protein
VSKRGAPRQFDRAETVQTICDLVARKQTLNQICQLPDMPSHETLRQWFLDEPELAAKYACARELRADARADRIDEITAMIINGELDPQAAKVVIDAEKWLAGKEQPKKYGDKVSIGGDPDNPLVHEHKHDISDDMLAAIATGKNG